ncbi:MAG: TRAP transporter fused permease subunit [Desulfobacterales bacterium]|nr:TRAP transporter fused permease subunit [Desulfobacterales bacterium]
MRKYEGRMAWLVKALSAIVPLYSIFFVLDISGYYLGFHFFATAYRSLFLLLILTLVFLLYPATKQAPRDRLPWYDILLILAAMAPTLYQFIAAAEIATGTKVGATGPEQVLFGLLLLVLCEGVRRTSGVPIVIIVALSLLYAKFAYFIPGLWGAPEFEWEALTEYMYLYDSGIFGMILGIAATLVIIFVTFGAFLFNAGAGEFLMNSAMALAGRWRGGPAKVAIIASGAMAMMSGSPSANVGTTGATTIPLMKKLGYTSHFAAAVEAVASTGGMITPPVMGSIAFVMAEITGLGYVAVVSAAVLPALLYYGCLFFQLDFEAARTGLEGLPRDQLPSLKKTLRQGWHLLLPIIILIVLLGLRLDVSESVLYAVAATVMVSAFSKRTRMGPRKIIDSLAEATEKILIIGPVLAAIGVVFGALTLTGLSVNLSVLIKDAAGDNIWLLAIYTWLVIYLSGAGMGELVVYIVMAIIVAPAFVEIGVPLLAAHMFLLFTGVSMFITPPYCPAVFVACSIAGSGMWRTAFQSMRLGIVVFLIPFMILFKPSLILIGAPWKIVLDFISSAMACYLLAGGTSGYLLTHTRLWQRFFLLVAGLFLFIPGWKTTLVGLAVAFLPFAAQLRSIRLKREEA